MLENYSRLNLYKHLLQNIELFDLIEYIYTGSVAKFSDKSILV